MLSSGTADRIGCAEDAARADDGSRISLRRMSFQAPRTRIQSNRGLAPSLLAGVAGNAEGAKHVAASRMNKANRQSKAIWRVQTSSAVRRIAA